MKPDEDGTVHIPGLACPWCGAANDGTFASSGERVVPDDEAVSICIYCVEPAIYIVSLYGVALRLPTEQERTQLLKIFARELDAIRLAKILRPLGEGGR